MALKERTVIDLCEILRDGRIQVREAKEIYDTETDAVRGREFHRYVVESDDKTPSDIQAFLDNSKA